MAFHLPSKTLGTKCLRGRLGPDPLGSLIARRVGTKCTKKRDGSVDGKRFKENNKQCILTLTGSLRVTIESIKPHQPGPSRSCLMSNSTPSSSRNDLAGALGTHPMHGSEAFGVLWLRVRELVLYWRWPPT